MKGQQHHWKSNHNKCERVADHSARLLQKAKRQKGGGQPPTSQHHWYWFWNKDVIV